MYDAFHADLYSRPKDATPIMRPSRNVVSFMPIDTLNTSRSQHGKLSHSFRHSDNSSHESSSTRKRKRETIHERMKGRPTVDPSQMLSNGLLVSRTASPDKTKNKTIDIDGDNEHGTKDKIDSNDRVSGNVSYNKLPSSPPVTLQGSLPRSNFKKPQHPQSKTVSLKIQQLQFGSYASFDEDLEFAITIMPKRIESVSEILRNGEPMAGFSFGTEKFYKLLYCLTTGDIVLKLKSRHTIAGIGATADTLIFQAKEDQTALMRFLGATEDTITKIDDKKEHDMVQILENLRYQPKRRSLPPYDSGQVSPHFTQAPTPKATYSSKDKEKKSPELLTHEQLDGFFPESWKNTHSMRTRSATSSTPKSSIVDNLDEYDMSDITHSDRATRSSRPKVYLGDPLKYNFGNKTVVITEDDFSRLDDGEFLNDTIIDFYLKYIQDRLQRAHPEIASSTYIFNTFFYKRLTQRINGVKGAFDNVKKWTAKVDLFSMKYVIIPIHERAHWYLAVIVNLCELGKAKPASGAEPGREKRPKDEDVSEIERVESDDDDDDDDKELASPKGMLDKYLPKKGTKGILPNEPVIFIFDSLKLRHNTVFRPLRDYLVAEAEDKRGITIERDHIKSKYGYAPAQPNYCDCGVYVAHYVEAFLSKPDAFLPLLVDTQNNKKLVEQQLNRLWEIDQLGSKRERMQKVILDLKKESAGVYKYEALPMSDTGIEELVGHPDGPAHAETSEVIDEVMDSGRENQGRLDRRDDEIGLRELSKDASEGHVLSDSD
ncbi:hypothetical protein V1506DRAFT_531627 [Lipomyces tetrasporus]